jgi:hypothetical protein
MTRPNVVLVYPRTGSEQVRQANRRLGGSGVTFNFAFMADFPTETGEDGEQMQTMFGRDRLRRALIAAYGRLVRLRCRRRWYRFTPEIDVLRFAVDKELVR